MTSSLDKRVVVGMSGGVDSSVAAWRLLEEGWDVHGLFMANWEEDEDGYCTSAQDFHDAREVCERLGIPLHRVSFAREYRERVFAHFLAEYRAGRTPNPDVLCNREIKFGSFVRYARRLGAGQVATGHYARLRTGAGGPELLRAADAAKDQTYFLHAASAESLALTRFPLGDLTKTEVRRIAEQQGFPNHAKKDSTGICFIGERPFREFLSRYLPARPGAIVDMEGTELGRHRGLVYYTLGQRQGLGIGGCRAAGELPWYVAGKDLAANRLIVVQGHDHPALLSTGLRSGPIHWIGAPPPAPLTCAVQTRHRQQPQACRAFPAGDGLEIRFEEPQRAVTPGQYVVLYAAERCLGGGLIEATFSEAPAGALSAVG